ncbi:MAG: diacylglycerol kinase [Candidatus Magasanikbacteria bacterium]|nr:diacylglycerol kinase [Candidatus Magasanikbacteria bacterium]
MLRRFLQSFRYAGRGLLRLLREERSFRVQTFIAAVVLILIGVFPLRIWEVIVVILSIVMVLILEILNSVVERLVDALKPRIHPYVEVIKDMMAGAVLIASLGAVIVGLIIFVPYLLDSIRNL